MTRVTSIITIVFLLLSTNCGGEEKGFQPELLFGKWDVTSAVRAKGSHAQATTLLDEVYFEFHENNTVACNFPAEGQIEPDKSYTYKIEEPQVLHLENSALTFSIDELTDTSLVLSTSLIGYNFNMRLHRIE